MSNLKNICEKLKNCSKHSIPLKTLLKDIPRCDAMAVEFDGITLDFSHQRITPESFRLLLELARSKNISQQINSMFCGELLNTTENRPVLHVALRAHKEDNICVNGKNLSSKVHAVLDKIQTLSDSLRNGSRVLSSGKPVQNVLLIGIGGSYLGVEAVYEALSGFTTEEKIPIRFLANVDPLAFHKVCGPLDAQSTVAIVVSKTFTTAETMLNARLVRDWFKANLPDPSKTSEHFLAVSSSFQKCVEFGIARENVFEMWDWVGGRFSVTSAVGVLPLSISFGSPRVREFLKGARSVDQHFLECPVEKNLPILMGLIGVWNSTFLGFESRAIVPYCEALSRFPAHVQQVEMESNGKGVRKDGTPLCSKAGEIVFGEPGTNAQHSFFQLLHQGRVAPVEFIGFSRCSNNIRSKDSTVSSHDELMSNFFAQADALAFGKESGDPQKSFEGNRPSLWLLFKEQNAYSIGQLVALYEHRVAVQGFLWGINSFDQFGVQLGKELGVDVRELIGTLKTEKRESRDSLAFEKLPHSSARLLLRYLEDNGSSL